MLFFSYAYTLNLTFFTQTIILSVLSVETNLNRVLFLDLIANRKLASSIVNKGPFKVQYEFESLRAGLLQCSDNPAMASWGKLQTKDMVVVC